MKRETNLILCEAVLGITLFLCTLFKVYKITLFISVISIIAYTFTIVVVFKDRFFLKYLWPFIASIFLLCGVFACDALNVWVAEINAITFYCGSFNMIALYYWAYYFIIRRMDPYFERHTKRRMTNIKIGNASITRKFIKNGNTIVFVFGLGLFLSVASHPFFIYGVTNRFEYAQGHISRLQNLLRVFPPVLAPLVIIPFIKDNKRNKASDFLKRIILPYVPYLLFLVWTGNKYGAFLELIIFIIVPLMMTGKLKIKIESLLKYGGILFLAIVAFLLLYYRLQGLNLNNALYQIYLRVACQGELWWKSVVTVENHGPDVNEFWKELSYQWQAVISEANIKNYGVYHLMRLLGRESIVQQYLSIGTRYAASGMELPYYCFGYWSFLRLLIICPITAWINNYFINAIREKRVFASIIAARIIMLLRPAFSQGDWYAFFSSVPLLFILGFIVIEVWNHTRKSVLNRAEQQIRL